MGGSSEALVFGEEEGTAEACRETGARHLPETARNEFGTPFLDHAFRVAAREARNKILCYVNADILLFPGLASSVQTVSNRFPSSLIVGRRWNFDVSEPFVFENDEEWMEKFQTHIESRGELYNGFNIDYFIYPAPVFADIPPFAVGRPGWDNWMIYEARRRQIPVIDATTAIFAAHQNHDYTHTQEGREGGKAALWRGQEAERNRELAGGHLLEIADATHILATDHQLLRNRNLLRFFQCWEIAPEIHPGFAWLFRPLVSVVRSLQRCDHQVRLWLLQRGLDLFPNRHKRQTRSR